MSKEGERRRLIPFLHNENENSVTTFEVKQS